MGRIKVSFGWLKTYQDSLPHGWRIDKGRSHSTLIFVLPPTQLLPPTRAKLVLRLFHALRSKPSRTLGASNQSPPRSSSCETSGLMKAAHGPQQRQNTTIYACFGRELARLGGPTSLTDRRSGRANHSRHHAKPRSRSARAWILAKPRATASPGAAGPGLVNFRDDEETANSLPRAALTVGISS